VVRVRGAHQVHCTSARNAYADRDIAGSGWASNSCFVG
jgi:hypothetical protein